MSWIDKTNGEKHTKSDGRVLWRGAAEAMLVWMWGSAHQSAPGPALHTTNLRLHPVRLKNPPEKWARCLGVRPPLCSRLRWMN